MHDEHKAPATASEIRALIGDVDAAVITGIMNTGASAAEVLQAIQLLRGGGGLEDEPGHEPHGTVKAVHDILQAEEPPEEP